MGNGDGSTPAALTGAEEKKLRAPLADAQEDRPPTRRRAGRVRCGVARGALVLALIGAAFAVMTLAAPPALAVGQRKWINSVAFSPDGARALSGSGDGTLRLWDLTTGQLLRALKGHSGDLTSVAFSSDGRLVLSGGWDKTVKLWDAAKGVLVRTFEGHSSPVASVAFSPDGRQVLSGSADNTVKLWDVATGQLLHTFLGHSGPVRSVAFSPDGRQVLSGSWDHTVKLWDPATGTVAWSAEDRSTSTSLTYLVQSVAFSPDGRQALSGGWGDTVKLWDAVTGELIKEFQGHASDVNSVAFSPDGRQVLSGSADNTVKLWDVGTGQLLHTFEGHSGPVQSVVFSPDGRQVLSGSADTTRKLWQLETGNLLASIIGRDGQWLAITPEGFFNASSPKAAPLLAIVRGLDAYGVDQLWQSLYAPDLVREKLADDPNGEVAKAAAVISLEKVLHSGKEPKVAITTPVSGASLEDEVITAEATITEQEHGGIGRVEWRVNGITVGVRNLTPGSRSALSLKRTLALDPGENTIEVVAYNGRNLLASVPAETKITWTGTASSQRPTLHVLAIGINKYVDKGGSAPGETETKRFPPLGLAVPDAKALADEFSKAAEGLYGGVNIRTVLDGEATAANLDAVVTEMAADIGPRDTFVLYAATHGYSYQGRFYLIPQDYQGGPDPQALSAHAIDQLRLQDWIANRIRAKKALILLDSCESGALTAGHTRSRFEGSTSDAAIGRLHEATGRPVLTAAGLGQSALELTELGHGVFTSALIDSLYRGDTNRDGVVSLSELVSHVQNLVPRLVKDPKARAEVIHRGAIGGPQSARFGGRGEDFPLVQSLQ